MQWQPIETAPADTRVIACNSAGYVGLAMMDRQGRWYDIAKPSYWMPIPTPPAT